MFALQILIIISLAILSLYLTCGCFRTALLPNITTEKFELVRERPSGSIQVTTLPNTSTEMQNITGDFNEIGNQLAADSEYDTVDTSVL